MPSQIELLQAAVTRLEPQHGADNPFVKGLKEQIVGLENQSSRQEQRLNLAVNSLPSAQPQQPTSEQGLTSTQTEQSPSTTTPAQTLPEQLSEVASLFQQGNQTSISPQDVKQILDTATQLSQSGSIPTDLTSMMNSLTAGKTSE